jgi:hypothetical protein
VVLPVLETVLGYGGDREDIVMAVIDRFERSEGVSVIAEIVERAALTALRNGEIANPFAE